MEGNSKDVRICVNYEGQNDGEPIASGDTLEKIIAKIVEVIESIDETDTSPVAAWYKACQSFCNWVRNATYTDTDGDGTTDVSTWLSNIIGFLSTTSTYYNNMWTGFHTLIAALSNSKTSQGEPWLNFLTSILGFLGSANTYTSNGTTTQMGEQFSQTLTSLISSLSYGDASNMSTSATSEGVRALLGYAKFMGLDDTTTTTATSQKQYYEQSLINFLSSYNSESSININRYWYLTNLIDYLQTGTATANSSYMATLFSLINFLLNGDTSTATSSYMAILFYLINYLQNGDTSNVASKYQNYLFTVLDSIFTPDDGAGVTAFTDLMEYLTTDDGISKISQAVTLGETEKTAYRGDRGKIAYDHSQSNHAPSDAEKNTIVSIMVNGVEQEPDDDRAVDITVSTDIYSNALDGAATHNAMARGKDLTDVYTDDEIAEMISSGTFKDLFIGDYVRKTVTTDAYGEEEETIYRFAAFDPILNSGDTQLTQHHALIIPDTCFKTAAMMNSSNTTEGGYYNCDMNTVELPKYLTGLQTAFSNHILTYRDLQTNGVSSTSGLANSWTRCDTTLRLLNEEMVCGSRRCSGSMYDTGYWNSQAPLFKFFPWLKNADRKVYWLSPVYNSTSFVIVHNESVVSFSPAKDTKGVRVCFLVG